MIKYHLKLSHTNLVYQTHPQLVGKLLALCRHRAIQSAKAWLGFHTHLSNQLLPHLTAWPGSISFSNPSPVVITGTYFLRASFIIVYHPNKSKANTFPYQYTTAQVGVTWQAAHVASTLHGYLLKLPQSNGISFGGHGFQAPWHLL